MDDYGSNPEFSTHETFNRHDPNVKGWTIGLRTQTARIGVLGQFAYSAFVPFGTPVYYGSQDSQAAGGVLQPFGSKIVERSRLEGAEYGTYGKGF